MQALGQDRGQLVLLLSQIGRGESRSHQPGHEHDNNSEFTL